MAFSIIQIHLKEKATINTESPEENTEQALMAISKEKFENILCSPSWGTHVYLWQIHFDVWQNQYNIVKFKNKIKLKKKIVTGGEKQIL